MDEIQSVQLNFEDERDDQISWVLDSSGKYSTSSAYNFQFVGQIRTEYQKLIWTAWAPPRCKFFLRLLLQDKFWTAARLQQRGWPNNYFCALCVRNLGTALHLFVECPFSMVVWTTVANWSSYTNLKPTAWNSSLDLEDWFSQLISGGGKLTHSLAILTIWTLWKQRNAVGGRQMKFLGK